jgi:hypothetical protein
MSDCSTCNDRRLVGGFLPAWCPDCGPEKLPAVHVCPSDAMLKSLRAERSSLQSRCDLLDVDRAKLCDHITELKGERDELAARCSAYAAAFDNLYNECERGYGGGYKTPYELDIFQHGMHTVCNIVMVTMDRLAAQDKETSK